MFEMARNLITKELPGSRTEELVVEQEIERSSWRITKIKKEIPHSHKVESWIYYSDNPPDVQTLTDISNLRTPLDGVWGSSGRHGGLISGMHPQDRDQAPGHIPEDHSRSLRGLS
jgi:hypothetical protein